MASAGSRVFTHPFNTVTRVEDPEETRNYLLMNDNSKVYGDKIILRSPLFSKEYLKIDDQKFQAKYVQAYFENGIYYKRFGAQYIRRIIHGTINVYFIDVEVTSTNTDSQGHTYTHTYTVRHYYYQKGDDDPLKIIQSEEQIKELVMDCPAAENLANLTNRQLRKTIKRNRNYMNEIFETYNNGCKPVRDKDSTVAIHQ
jgi:hypothetical protein